jgi:hypothetical protein
MIRRILRRLKGLYEIAIRDEQRAWDYYLVSNLTAHRAYGDGALTAKDLGMAAALADGMLRERHKRFARAWPAPSTMEATAATAPAEAAPKSGVN